MASSSSTTVSDTATVKDGVSTTLLSSSPLETVRKDQQDTGNWDDHRSYMQVKRRKLQDQYFALGQRESTIFAGVIIYVNGYTNPEADELKRMIQAHGGGYEYMPYSSAITHMIATNLPTAKIRRLNENSTAVCTPAWIVDSIAAGKQLSIDHYRLYSVDKAQRKLKFGHVAAKQYTDPGTSDEWLELEEELGKRDNSVLTDVSNPPTCATNRIDNANSIDFVSEFYSHSRLHYLSTWSTELKQFTAKMLPQATQKIPLLSSSLSLKSEQSRAVVHLDVDCFFVQVSIMDKPHLKGKPIAVTHAKKNSSPIPAVASAVVSNELGNTDLHDTSGQEATSVPHRLLHSTSDVASCSYEARKCGIKNGMSVGKALELCPDLTLVPYEFDKYRKVSQALYEILMSYSHLVEAVSCDEAFFELTDYAKSFVEVGQIVKQIRDEVEERSGCTVSAGISHNMLLARMATRKAKPNGQYYLPMIEAKSYLADQPVADLPGVGWSLRKRLEKMDIRTCGDLQKVSLVKLKEEFGERIGETLYQSCRGESSRQLKLVSERKSISVDINFGIRFSRFSEAENHVSQLAQELQRRATEASVSGSCVTLKMKIRKPTAPVQTWKYLGHGACDNVSRSSSLSVPTRRAEDITRIAVQLLKNINPTIADIRGMGLQLTKLVSGDSPSKKIVPHVSDIRSLFSSSCQPSSSRIQFEPIQGLGLKQDMKRTTDTDIRSLFSNSVQQKCQSSSSTEVSSVQYGYGLDLPPPSQLDYSVLLELPVELQEKIMNSYSAQSNQSSFSTVANSKNSAVAQSTNKSEDITAESAENIPELLENANPNLLDEGGEERIVFEDQTKFVEEMRDCIRHWVRTFTIGPNDVDFETFRSFLESLCSENMEVTDAALRCFRRSVLRQDLAVWYRSFNSVLESVQRVMITRYGNTLDIDSITV